MSTAPAAAVPALHPHELALRYPLGDRLPAAGEAVEVAPGVRWLRMKLPFALDHINLWLLRDRQHGVEGWTVVDCGIDDADTRARWAAAFAGAFDGLPLLRVVCTHMHPDHLGLAHWLTGGAPEVPAVDGCRLWISATDYHVARIACQLPTSFGGEGAARFFRLHGLLDEDSLAQVRARSHTYYTSLVPALPPQYRRLLDGMVLEIGGIDWHCIAGHGHAPEHIALHAPALGVLISGDMVLPRISTNVSVVESEPEGDPLPQYLASLDRLRPLPPATRVLPSHGRPFTGLHVRIDQLHAHHAERLADVWAACAQAPCSAAELLPVLFRRALDLHQTTFAMGESVAHVHALAGRGKLQPLDGADGVRRWRAVGGDAGGGATRAAGAPV